MARVRIKVRDFFTILGMGIPSGPLILFLTGEVEFDEFIVVFGVSLLIGIPILIVGLRKQSRFSKAWYGDNRHVWRLLLGWPIGIIFALLLIRCSAK